MFLLLVVKRKQISWTSNWINWSDRWWRISLQ